jgi:hypothetical protein
MGALEHTARCVSRAKTQTKNPAQVTSRSLAVTSCPTPPVEPATRTVLPGSCRVGEGGEDVSVPLLAQWEARIATRCGIAHAG